MGEKNDEKNDDFLKEFLKQDRAAVAKLAKENPKKLSCQQVSDFLGLHVDSVRMAIADHSFGLSWRQLGKTQRGFFISTPQFVRWYLNMGEVII